MEIREQITIELSAEDINELVVDYLTAKGYKVIGKPSVNIDSKYEGDYPRELTKYLKNISTSVERIQN